MHQSRCDTIGGQPGTSTGRGEDRGHGMARCEPARCAERVGDGATAGGGGGDAEEDPDTAQVELRLKGSRFATDSGGWMMAEGRAMRSGRHFKVALVVVAGLLASAYLVRGFVFALRDPADLSRRWVEQQYVIRGQNP